jgi:hypothetical protein
MTGMMDFGMDSKFPARLGLEEIASPGDESAHSNLGENGHGIEAMVIELMMLIYP